MSAKFLTTREMFPGAELKDPHARWMALHALEILWAAMDLSHPPCGILEPDGPTREQYRERYDAWKKLGDTILGRDCPQHEIKT